MMGMPESTGAERCGCWAVEVVRIASQAQAALAGLPCRLGVLLPEELALRPDPAPAPERPGQAPFPRLGSPGTLAKKHGGFALELTASSCVQLPICLPLLSPMQCVLSLALVSQTSMVLLGSMLQLARN